MDSVIEGVALGTVHTLEVEVVEEGAGQEHSRAYAALALRCSRHVHRDREARDLWAAANSSGGVLAKMISPQNLAIAAAAVGLGGREGDIFRKVIGWSLALIIAMAVLVYLQSTPVLSWMVP